MGNLTEWFGVAADFGGHYKNYSLMARDLGRIYTSTFTAGPRFALRRSPFVVPYAQFLLGYVRSDTSSAGRHETETRILVGVVIRSGAQR